MTIITTPTPSDAQFAVSGPAPALPVAHQAHPFWAVLLKVLEVAAAIAPAVAASTGKASPATLTEITQLSSVASTVSAALDASSAQ